jgi:putative hydrolase of the HAD superfamily
MLANGPKAEFVVDSCRIGVRKPDPRFFAHACAIAQVEPASCLLIDDFHGNCAEARRQGWSVVHFRNTEQAVGEMKRLLEERNR